MADDWTVARALDFLADHFQGVASGAADNDAAPLKIGGVYRTVLPTFVDGERSELVFGSRGSAHVEIYGRDSAGGAGVGVPADGFLNANSGLLVADFGLLFNGASWDRQRTPSVFKPILNVAVVAGTPAVVWTPAAGKKFRLMGLALSLSVAGFLSLDDGVSVLDLVRLPAMPAGQGIDVETFGNGLLAALANNTLRVDVSANGNVNGMVWGTEE